MKKFFLVFLVFLIFILLSLFYFLNKPLKTQNILIFSNNLEREDPLVLLRFEPSKDYQLLKFDPNSQVELPAGYGQYPLRSIYSLLKLDKQPVSFITALLSKAVEVPIDKLLPLNQVPEGFLTVKSSKYELLLMVLGKYGHLSFSRRLLLLRVVFQTKPSEKFESKLHHPGEAFFDEKALDCSLAVNNATQTTGLAGSYAQIATHNGFRVVRVDDAAENRAESALEWDGRDEDCKILIARLAAFLPEPKLIINPQILSQSRAEIRLSLGEDLN